MYEYMHYVFININENVYVDSTFNSLQIAFKPKKLCNKNWMIKSYM